jgi:3-phenylpropionate/cinnamic acid dioxygenase small subunit
VNSVVLPRELELANWVPVERLLAQSGDLLDQERFDAWLELFTADARYEVTTWSPELKQDQIWLQADKPELASLLENIDRHIRDRATRGHLVTLVDLIRNDHSDTEAAQFEAVSRFLLLRTDDTGGSTVYLTGRYLDVVRMEPNGPRLAARHVRLDTRLFTVGSHLPV